MKMLNKQSISLCMITKNEEKFLEQCLNSVKDIVDEIIVVDTGSTDKTKEIANKFKAEIYDFNWIDDFSAARNESLKHATRDWILVLDADEVLSSGDLIRFKDLLLDDCVGYYFTIRTYTNDANAAGWVSSKNDKYEESKKASGWFTTKLIRLFRNHKSISFRGIIHETIDHAIHSIGIVKEASITIHHFGRLNDDKIEFKRNMYKQLSELKLSQKTDFHAFSQLAIQAQEMGDYGQAVNLFKKSIELNRDYYKSWLNLGACYLKLGSLKEAESALRHAVTLNSSDYSAHNNLGIVYSKQQEPQLAIQEFLMAIKLNPFNASAFLNLGVAYDSIGAKDEAYEAFKKAIELNPKYKDKIKLN